MAKSEHGRWSLGLFARLPRVFGRAAGEAEEQPVEAQPEPGELSGPSGLPAAPLRVEKRASSLPVRSLAALQSRDG